MPTNYSITYKDEEEHDRNVCQTGASSVTFALVADGVVQHSTSSGPRYVDLLTIYYTKNSSGQYPSPPETFTINLTYSTAHEVEEIYKDAERHSPSIVATETVGQWTLTVNGPTADDEITNFQLNTDEETPPHKLKIRVKRQPSFDCTNGPFDDRFGVPLP